jgi:hypothetical protein
MFYHPLFERWLAALGRSDEEILGEVLALLTALETHGRDLDDERREESHPVVTSRFDMHALRRTQPTASTPYADAPPVLRILYAICRDTDSGEEVAVVLLGGDKSSLQSQWYPPNVTEAEFRLEQLCRNVNTLAPFPKRGRR